MGHTKTPSNLTFSTHTCKQPSGFMVCSDMEPVEEDFHRFASAEASLLRDYPCCAHKYSQHTKLLWKTSIDRRRPMHNKEVWMHHYSSLTLCTMIVPIKSTFKKPLRNSQRQKLSMKFTKTTLSTFVKIRDLLERNGLWHQKQCVFLKQD